MGRGRRCPRCGLGFAPGPVRSLGKIGLVTGGHVAAIVTGGLVTGLVTGGLPAGLAGARSSSHDVAFLCRR